MERRPRDALPLREIEQGEEMAIDGVNAAIADESHEVQRPAGLAHVARPPR